MLSVPHPRVACLVLLILLAGCSGGGAGTTATDPGIAPEATTAAPTPTATDATTPTPTPTPTETVTPTQGTASDVDLPYATPLNATTVMDVHEARVREAGNFRLNTTVVAALADNESRQDTYFRTAALDLSNDRLTFTEYGTAGTVREAYVEGDGRGYLRVEQGGETTYGRPQQYLIERSQYVSPRIDPFVEGFAYTYNGTVQRDGERLHRYLATDVEAADDDALRTAYFSGENATALRAELLVTEEGLVRQYSYEVTGDAGDLTIVYSALIRYDDVGSTTVEEPGWTDTVEGNVTTATSG